MDLDDYLNLQSHSDGSTHELQDLLSPTHDGTGTSTSTTGTNVSTLDVTKTIASSNTTTSTAATENEQVSLPANYPMFSTTTPTCWNDQMALTTNEEDTSRLFDKPLPDVEQFLYSFGDGNSAVPAASNWNVLEQHQNQHGLSLTTTPLPDLAATMSGGLPDFLAPHFLSLTDMEKTNNGTDNNNNVMVQQTNPLSLPTTTENDTLETTGMVTRSKRQKRTTDKTAVSTIATPAVSTVAQQNDTPAPSAVIPSPPPKKKRAKKLYCICQKPYDGQPMVQCDGCKEWFHCGCMNLDADEMDNVDWICDNCKAGDNTVSNSEEPAEQTAVQLKKTSTRRSRHHHTCLLSTCSNHTRANSYCSDVCARLDTTTTTHPQGGSIKSKSKKRTRSIASADSSDTDISKNDPDDLATDSATSSPPPANESSSATIDPVRKNVLKPLTTTLTPILTQMADQLPEALEHQVSNDPLEAAESLAIQIEGAIFEYLGDQDGGNGDQGKKHCGSRYKNKVRSLLYNLRDKANKEFQLRVVRGDLTPDALAHMSSEDMANPTLKSMSETLREKSIKDIVLKIDNTPIIKKTHKGDIIMNPRKGNDKRNNSGHDSPSSSSSSSFPSMSKLPSTTNTIDTDSTRNLGTDAIKIAANTTSGWASSIHASTKSAPGISTTTHTPLVMTRDKMDALWKQIGITKNDDGMQQHKEHDTNKTKRSSVDLEALLGKEDDNEQLYAGDEDDGGGEAANDPGQTIVWNGRVAMPDVASFDASARQIGGRTLTKEEWQQVLPSSMNIEGRIRVEAATKYVSSMRYSSSRELVVLELKCQTSSASNQRHMQTLLNYFDSLKRFGVVGHDKTKIKDFYLLPLSQSQRIPDALYVVPAEERQCDADLFLGVLVITKQQQQQQQKQQQQPRPQRPKQQQPRQQQYHEPLANSNNNSNNSSISHSSISYPHHPPYYPT